jgi:hypothetical protein
MTLRLVFTTSIITPDREQIYVDAIRDTLSKLHHIPLKAYVVENNGERPTALDTIEEVEVMYTNTNTIKALQNPSRIVYSSGKAQKEMLDLLFVADRYSFQDDDIVIKLTGRYTLASPLFFDTLLTKPHYDVYMKFFNVCTREYDPVDCVMGLYACRYHLLRDFDYTAFANHPSTEQVLAAYIRESVQAERIYELSHLDMNFQGDATYCI